MKTSAQENPEVAFDLVLSSALLPEGGVADIGVRDGRIETLHADAARAERVLDCSGLLVLPPLVNAHTHSAMTLFRGWGDDLPLQRWLQERIWPAEARMTADDVRVGTAFACVEMIRTGTLFFNEMYWHPDAVVDAAVESGLRAVVCGVLIDMFDPEKAARQKDDSLRLMERIASIPGGRVRFALGPHSPYTVSEETLAWCAEFSRKYDIPVHIHLSETAEEVERIRREHGMSPVRYLDRLGLLSNRLYAAHCVWLEDGDIELLAERGVKVFHIPASNMKLAVGGTLRLRELKEAGVTVLLGTDGCASNNNLDMFEEMKIAALTQKASFKNPQEVSAAEIWEMATSAACKAFGLPCGRIEPGYAADLILVDAEDILLTPSHDLVANLVYSANGYCVKGAVCDGRVLMWDGRIEGMEEIRAELVRRAERLCSS